MGARGACFTCVRTYDALSTCSLARYMRQQGKLLEQLPSPDYSSCCTLTTQCRCMCQTHTVHHVYARYGTRLSLIPACIMHRMTYPMNSRRNRSKRHTFVNLSGGLGLQGRDCRRASDRSFLQKSRQIGGGGGGCQDGYRLALAENMRSASIATYRHSPGHMWSLNFDS